MIECKYIANVYKFTCAYDEALDKYFEENKLKALVIHLSDSELCDIYIYDTFVRPAYNCYYDLGGVKIRRIDSGAMLEILESLGIDVNSYDVIHLQGIHDEDKDYERSVEND